MPYMRITMDIMPVDINPRFSVIFPLCKFSKPSFANMNHGSLQSRKATMDFSLANIHTAIAGFFALCLVFFHIVRRNKPSKTSDVPPKASGAWPIIGHLHLIGGGSKLPHIVLGAMADKHGPIFHIRLGVHPAIVVSSWEITKELFNKCDIAISSRPKFIAGEHLGHNYVNIGFCPYSSYWAELRKIISLELLSNRRLELLKHVQVSETEASMKELYKLWTDNFKDASASGHGGVMADMDQWIWNLSLKVILRMIVGKQYFGDAAAGDDKAARRCQDIIKSAVQLGGLFLVGDNLPFLRWLDFGGYEKAMKKTAKEIDGLTGKWLEEHRRKKERSLEGEANIDQDFMDVMLSVFKTKSADLDGYDLDTITKATCMALIVGGSDTTAIQLTWVLSLVMNNRRVLEKAQEELDIHVGKERHVNFADLNNLVYLQAIVKESLRLHPAGALGGQREFTKDCTLNGYHIPKGTRLVLNLWKLHRDPRVWPEPLEFRPERFLTTHKDVDVKGHHFELIPFSSGRRRCPGITLGLQMLHFALARLLQGFELSNPSDAPIDMTQTAGISNSRANPLHVLVAPRLSPSLY